MCIVIKKEMNRVSRSYKIIYKPNVLLFLYKNNMHGLFSYDLLS